MSESTTDTSLQAATEAAETVETTETTETKPEAAQEATEAQQEATEGDGKKGDWRELALKRETRLKHEARRELEAARAELEILRARVQSRDGGENQPQPKTETMGADAVRAEAARLLEQERRQQATRDLIQQGVKELGADAWNEKTNIIAQLGAADNEAFMDALREMPGEAPKLVAALADDPTRLESLLAKRPAAMAAELGRMAAELTAPKVAPISKVPAPVKPISGRGTLPEPDLTKMNAQELVAYWNSKSPQRVAGRKR